jgi:hypothetical protein
MTESAKKIDNRYRHGGAACLRLGERRADPSQFCGPCDGDEAIVFPLRARVAAPKPTLRLTGCPRCGGTTQPELDDPGTWACAQCGHREYGE